MGTRIAIVLSALLAGWTVQATTIRVPEDHPSVLAGVDAAFPGDSVLVGPGTWTAIDTRVLIINGDPITVTSCAFPRGGVAIVGTAGRDATIVDASVEDTGAGYLTVIVLAEQFGQGTLTLEGLSITGARRPIGAEALPALRADGLVVRSCRIFGNESNSLQGISAGAAISARECNVEVVDTVIDHNVAIAGVVLDFDGSLTIRGCRFEENRGECIQVDTEVAWSSVVLIEDSEFLRNRGRGFGVGVDLAPVQGFTIRRCRFVENVAETQGGGGVRVSGSGWGQIQHCVFERDSCLASNLRGGGVRWEGSTGEVSGNTFVACHSALGGAAFSGRDGVVRFEHNLVTHSTGGAAVNVTGTTLIPAGCNDFWANAGGDFGIWTPDATDFFLDPLFCDPAVSDYTLRDDSPCIVGPCGQVGALGAGCEGLAVEPTSWGKLKNLYR